MYMIVKKIVSIYKILIINVWNVFVLKNIDSYKKMYIGNCFRKFFLFLIEIYIY